MRLTEVGDVICFYVTTKDKVDADGIVLVDADGIVLVDGIILAGEIISKAGDKRWTIKLENGETQTVHEVLIMPGLPDDFMRWHRRQGARGV